MTSTETTTPGTELAAHPHDDWCVVDVHPNIFDLTGKLRAQFYNKTDPAHPVHIVHADQVLVVKVTVVLGGRIVSYLCDTELCVCLAFETCGSGEEFEICRWITLEPCKTLTYEFEIEVAAGTLVSGECGKSYEVCVTLGSRDCCKKPGFIFGSCKHFDLTVMPADVSGTPA
jgi:hypothetical protein